MYWRLRGRSGSRKLDAYLKRLFGNQKIRVCRGRKRTIQPKSISRGIRRRAFVDDEDDDRSFQFQMATLEEDLVEQG